MTDPYPGLTTAALEQLQAWLKEFVSKHLGPDPEVNSKIRLKYDHSLRVYDQATSLASELGLPQAKALTARVAALVHDLGRFPQFSIYKTFRDEDSANHASLGLEVLRQHQPLRRIALPRPMRRDVQLAVLLHNRKALPQWLTPWHDQLCSLVRDADKLDIFAVLLEYFERPRQEHDPTLTLGLRPDPRRYSPAMIDQVADGGLVDYQKMVWINDFKLLLASWVQNLAFLPSRRRLLSSGLLDRLLATLPSDQTCQDLARTLRHKAAGD